MKGMKNMKFNKNIQVSADVYFTNEYPTTPVLVFTLKYKDFLGSIEMHLQYNPKTNKWNADVINHDGSYTSCDECIDELKVIIDSYYFIFASNKVVYFLQYCFDNHIDNLGYYFVSIEDGKYITLAAEGNDYYAEEFSSVYEMLYYLKYGLTETFGNGGVIYG